MNYSESEYDTPPSGNIQGSAKEWSLGCVITASWPPLAVGARFTQPRDHSLLKPCSCIYRDFQKVEFAMTNIGRQKKRISNFDLKPGVITLHLNPVTHGPHVLN